jgi:hypothetical protein
MRDPIIAEVRRVRRKLDKLYEEHPEEFRARLKATEEKYKDLLVDLQLRPIRGVASGAMAKARGKRK